jgi:hypothetical protein
MFCSAGASAGGPGAVSEGASTSGSLRHDAGARATDHRRSGRGPGSLGSLTAASAVPRSGGRSWQDTVRAALTAGRGPIAARSSSGCCSDGARQRPAIHHWAPVTCTYSIRRSTLAGAPRHPSNVTAIRTFGQDTAFVGFLAHLRRCSEILRFIRTSRGPDTRLCGSGTYAHPVPVAIRNWTGSSPGSARAGQAEADSTCHSCCRF